MALNEFELIKRYFYRQAEAGGVVLGIGDDCAVLNLPAGESLAVTVDTLVEGVHFPAGADPELVAQRALRVNLSDVAAMGAEPLWFTLALTLPEVDTDWLTGFSKGLFAAAAEYNCGLVGGDTTRGPLTITVQVMAAIEQAQILSRAGARPGDHVYVTGRLGDGAAALAVIQNELDPDATDRDYLRKRFYCPVPRVKEGQLLKGLASAAIDVSDGLLADLGHICQASGVGARIHLERLPLSAALERLADTPLRRSWILGGGDDYELCFTVPPSRLAQVEQLISDGALDACAIGEIHEQQGVSCLYQGQAMSVEQKGYRHFDGS